MTGRSFAAAKRTKREGNSGWLSNEEAYGEEGEEMTRGREVVGWLSQVLVLAQGKVMVWGIQRIRCLVTNTLIRQQATRLTMRHPQPRPRAHQHCS
jgi:hypothetical protein